MAERFAATYSSPRCGHKTTPRNSFGCTMAKGHEGVLHAGYGYVWCECGWGSEAVGNVDKLQHRPDCIAGLDRQIDAQGQCIDLAALRRLAALYEMRASLSPQEAAELRLLRRCLKRRLFAQDLALLADLLDPGVSEGV